MYEIVREQYADKLAEMADKGIIRSEELAAYKLPKKAAKEAQLLACGKYYFKVLDDNILTDLELLKLKALINFSDLDEKIRTRFLDSISGLNAIYRIRVSGELPSLPPSDIPIVFKKDEILHFVSAASTYKKKRATKRIDYAGPTASIKICKGVRYRLGSISPRRVSSEFWDVDDQGKFFITSQRIGFIGEKSNFTIAISKILSLQDGDNGLNIFKEGRQSPFVLQFPPYDLPLFLISALMDGIEKLPAPQYSDEEKALIEKLKAIPERPTPTKVAATGGGCLLHIICALVFLLLFGALIK